MPVIATVKRPEEWIMEINGGYDICFTEHKLTVAATDGKVLVKATDGIDGIMSGDGAVGDVVRVMVRGNPSKVIASKLTGVTTGLDKSIVLI